MADRRCLQQVEILKIEGLEFVKPLWPAVVASGGFALGRMFDLSKVQRESNSLPRAPWYQGNAGHPDCTRDIGPKSKVCVANA